MYQLSARFRVVLAVSLAGLLSLPCLARGAPADDRPRASASLRVYVAGDGIHVYRMNTESGALAHEGATREAKPSFLAVHPSGSFLYGAGGDGLSAFAIAPDSGALSFLNRVSSGGRGPCHLVVDKTGTNVLTANYGDGSVSVVRIEENGALGKRASLMYHKGSSVNPQRQTAPHAHSINLDPGNGFAFAADLGIDKVVAYRFDPLNGTLEFAEPAAVKPGAGPRHFAFHPSGRFAYVINELDSTVTAFTYDAKEGRLEVLEVVSSLPRGFEGKNYPAEILVGPSGRFLYGSNRGHDSIVVFAIDYDSGRLRLVEHESTRGEWPRNFRLDPSGRFLLAANQTTGTIAVFRVDAHSGALEPTPYVYKTPSPACIRFLQQTTTS